MLWNEMLTSYWESNFRRCQKIYLSEAESRKRKKKGYKNIQKKLLYKPENLQASDQSECFAQTCKILILNHKNI